jgi:hypothetical protein
MLTRNDVKHAHKPLLDQFIGNKRQIKIITAKIYNAIYMWISVPYLDVDH